MWWNDRKWETNDAIQSSAFYLEWVWNVISQMDTLFYSALSENSRLKTMPICHSTKQTPAAKINSKGGMGISNSISEFLTQSNPISQNEDTIKLIGAKNALASLCTFT